MDSDFEFAEDGTTDFRPEDFEGWGFDGAKKAMNGNKRIVDVDEIVRRRRGTKGGVQAEVNDDKEEIDGADEDEDMDMDDFIDDEDEEEDGAGAMAEEEREERRRERRKAEMERRKAMRSRPELMGMDEHTWDEILEVFGDGHDYDWALTPEDEDNMVEESTKPEIRYHDVRYFTINKYIALKLY